MHVESIKCRIAREISWYARNLPRDFTVWICSETQYSLIYTIEFRTWSACTIAFLRTKYSHCCNTYVQCRAIATKITRIPISCLIEFLAGTKTSVRKRFTPNARWTPTRNCSFKSSFAKLSVSDHDNLPGALPHTQAEP
jgi:hypothetical protein